MRTCSKSKICDQEQITLVIYCWFLATKKPVKSMVGFLLYNLRESQSIQNPVEIG